MTRPDKRPLTAELNKRLDSLDEAIAAGRKHFADAAKQALRIRSELRRSSNHPHRPVLPWKRARIVFLRQKLGYTIEKLAAEVHLSPGTIWNVLHEAGLTEEQTLARLAGATEAEHDAQADANAAPSSAPPDDNR